MNGLFASALVLSCFASTVNFVHGGDGGLRHTRRRLQEEESVFFQANNYNKIKNESLAPYSSDRNLIVDTTSYNQLVRVGADGTTLEYELYENMGASINGGDSNQVPDFSGVGYKGGGVPLPFISAEEVLDPSGGDDTTLVQDAINRVQALPLDGDGFRGAVLLRSGDYTISEPLTITNSGVVLRGQGQGVGGTKLQYTKPVKSDFINIGDGSARYSTSTWYDIANFVPSGAKTFTINSNAHGWTVGTTVVLELQPNQAWLDDMSNM